MKKFDVLVVDDQFGIRYLLDIVIREGGHNVYTAQNGLEAVEMAQVIKPDVIFMDVRMPLMNGLDALKKIKQMLPEVKVFMMTAYGSEDVIDQALEYGASRCLIKPFDVEDILEILKELTWGGCVCEDGAGNFFKAM